MDLSQYLEIFIDESKEHLQSLNESLLILEKNPLDTSVINEIFRVAHTIKGMAGTMGFTKMATLTHDMEDVLQTLRTGEIQANASIVDVLFKCLDALDGYVNDVVTQGAEGEEAHDDIIKALKIIIETKGQLPDAETKEMVAAISEEVLEKPEAKGKELDQYEQNAVNKAIRGNLNVFKLTIKFNPGCVLKAARAFIVFQKLELIAEVIKAIPPVEDIEDEKFDTEIVLYIVTEKDKDYIYSEIMNISEIDEVIVENVDAAEVEEVKKEAAAAEKEEKKKEEVKAAESKDVKKTDSAQNTSQAKPKTGKTVRVDIDRLDTLMNLVSELIIIKTRLEGLELGDKSSMYVEAVEYLERITTSLHDAVTKVRMVPVETVFNRFPRMIRDIARDLNKEIELSMFGEETELDRTVIDEIGDPLIHILRNSADHGIESLEDRRAAGKPDEGHIYLRAYQDGNNVVIEVEDDGKGIAVEKVRSKIVERGLLNRESADNLSKEEVIDYLFRPSFSTADKITDLSGRGVGLDVVKTKIESLSGNVEVETTYGKGSKFIIRLPLTLAIIQALLVNIGTEKYAIPLNSVQQIIDVDADDIKLVQKKEVIMYRDSIVPIVRLAKFFDAPMEEKKQQVVVIVKKGDRLFGFIVDSLFGQQEIVIKSLGKLLAGIKYIAGATILGDGNVALILDINTIV
jgi:two-component system chemotaxis sensor kinase CheA